MNDAIFGDMILVWTYFLNSSVIGKQNSVISRLDRLQCSAFTTYKHKIRSNTLINKPFGT